MNVNLQNSKLRIKVNTEETLNSITTIVRIKLFSQNRTRLVLVAITIVSFMYVDPYTCFGNVWR